jgi:hypothetical protein
MLMVFIIIVLIMFAMFLYSGVDKIINFEKKVLTLNTKTNNVFPLWLLNIAMVLVILLEIIGSIIIILTVASLRNPDLFKKLLPVTNVVFILLLLFLIVVTFIYHPPTQGLIPFLSNCTTFGGIAVLGLLLNNSEIDIV